MKKNIKKIILLFITFVFLYLVFVNINVSEFIMLIKGFDFRYVFLLMISISLSLFCRGICFSRLISKTVPDAKIKDLTALCFTGASLNIVLPARAGDLFRAYYTGYKYNADKVKIFGTVMLERIFDVLVIFSFLTIGVFVYHRNALAVNLCLFAGILILSGVVFAVVTYKYNQTDRICSYIKEKTEKIPFSELIQKATDFLNKTCNSFFEGFEVIDTPKNILIAIIAAIGIWSFECLNFLIVIYGFGCELHWSVTIFIISFIAMACMIPSTSIFIGPYQLAVISAFAIYDVSKETALAMSLLEQAVVTIFVSFVAAVYLIKNNISYKDIKKDIGESID